MSIDRTTWANRGRRKPVYRHPDKIERSGRHLGRAWVENVFFVLVMLLSFGFAVLLLLEVRWSWSLLLFLVLFWVVMAYLALPRLQRVLTSIYVPDYFIGRSRTGDGLLGDPLNLAVMGSEEQIHEAMTRAGWTRADPVTLASSARIVYSSLARRSYAAAPVSPLVLFNKTQAFAYQQEVEGNPSQRHHVRFWPTPAGWLLPGGTRVDWLASGTYDRAVGLSLFTLQVTHKIDRNIDVERDYVIGTVLHAVEEADVHVIENFSTGYHSRNGGGDAVQTDGNLPTLHLEEVEVQVKTERADGSSGATAVGEARSGRGRGAGASSSDNARDVLTQVGRRPIPVVAAFVLTVASALVAIAGVLWRDHEALGDSGPDVINGVPVGVSETTALWISVLAYVPILWLAWLTFRGGLWARLTMIALVTASQAWQMWQYLQGGRPTMTALLGLSIDLLIVYALTSLASREWAETGRAESEGVPND